MELTKIFRPFLLAIKTIESWQIYSEEIIFVYVLLNAKASMGSDNPWRFTEAFFEKNLSL